MITASEPLVRLEEAVQHMWGFFNQFWYILVPLFGMALFVYVIFYVVPLLRERKRQKQTRQGRQTRKAAKAHRSDSNRAARRSSSYRRGLAGTLAASPRVQTARARRGSAIRMALRQKHKARATDMPDVWGNPRTMIVHVQGCPEIAHTLGLRSFTSIEQAVGEGFEKCEVCIE